MSSQASRPAATGEGAAPADALEEPQIRKFGQTKAAADRNLPRFVLSDLEGEAVVIHSCEPFDGKFGLGYRVVITRTVTGERGVLLGHWSVLSKLLESMVENDELPVEAVIVKAEGKRYFDLADSESTEV
jgi:hypothetical protein